VSLFKSASVVSLFTLLSRITGLVRELLIASTFGASAMTDAFNVAFRIPNLFRRFFGEEIRPSRQDADTQQSDKNLRKVGLQALPGFAAMSSGHRGNQGDEFR